MAFLARAPKPRPFAGRGSDDGAHGGFVRHTVDAAVLALVRRRGGQSLVGLFNFSERPQTVRLDSAASLGLAASATLAPYEAKIM